MLDLQSLDVQEHQTQVYHYYLYRFVEARQGCFPCKRRLDLIPTHPVLNTLFSY